MDAGSGEDDKSNAVDPETIDEDDGREAESSDGSDNASNESDEELNDSRNEAGEETDNEADEETDENSLDHPSAKNIAHSPILGPEPTNSEATLIMFDSPACPACAYFEENAFQELNDHVDAGTLSIVWRGVPAIEDWADAILQVLWATYERNIDAFWDLRAHTFEIQDSIDNNNEAVDRLIAHLAETTSLDVETIRSETKSRAYEHTVALDKDAAAHAGLDATPYFFLFRKGEFRTEIRGAQDYRVFENALEL